MLQGMRRRPTVSDLHHVATAPDLLHVSSPLEMVQHLSGGDTFTRETHSVRRENSVQELG